MLRARSLLYGRIARRVWGAKLQRESCWYLIMRKYLNLVARGLTDVTKVQTPDIFSIQKPVS